MKLELDYDCKTITIKDKVNLKELKKELKKLGIDDTEWDIKTETYPLQPYYYFTNPFFTEITTGTITGDFSENPQMSLTTNC